MRNKSFAVTAVVGLMASLLVGDSSAAPATAPTLGIGSPAPALALTHWYKGTPFKTFEPGKVYVVEFWATWCAPCKKSIPHLTELQKKYQDKITFLGVDVWEHPDDETDAAIADLAKPFVEQMGDQMGYSVAGDGAAATMTKTWLEPAKQQGIPTSFVIDGKGQIAWIGHPMDLEPVLEKVVAGTWDVALEKKKADDARTAAANAPENKVMAKLMAARQAHDNAAMLAALDEVDSGFPKLAAHPDLISMRLEALIQTDGGKAVAYVQKLTAPGGQIAVKPEFSWSVTRVVPEAKESLLTQDQWKAIANAVDPMIAPGDGKSGPIYSAYAELLRRGGQHDLAVFYQRKAVNLIVAYQNGQGSKATKADADYLKKEQARLDALTAGPGQAGGAS